MSILPLCRLLDWDSNFFGIKIGQITANHLTANDIPLVLEWCRVEQVRCLYFLCAPDHDESVLIAEKYHFHLVDIRIELEYQMTSENEPQVLNSKFYTVRPFCYDDLSDLIEITNDSISNTRFFYDQNFSFEQASDLYRVWITKSCEGFADGVLVATSSDGVVGFITYHIDSSQFGRIGLVGVRKEMQGLGIGQLLIETAKNYLAQHKLSKIFISTQGRNLIAQRLYNKCGFRAYSLNLWYHKWFD